MLSTYILKTLSLISGTAFLCGCASVCTSIPSDNTESAKIGTSFFNKAEISHPYSTDLSNGFVQATSTISNLSSDSQTIQYRFIWFNDAGVPVGNNMPWTPLQLYPDLSKTVAAASPNESITKFHVEACMLKPTNNLVTFYRD
jgi:uncharacterized protein YcfL